MSTKLKTGVPAASKPVFEPSYDMFSDFKEMFGVEKDPGFTYQIVDATPEVLKVKPSVVSSFLVRGWKKIAESEVVPGMVLIGMPTENYEQLLDRARQTTDALTNSKINESAGAIAGVKTWEEPDLEALTTKELAEINR